MLRKYPIGIQSFRKIREGGYGYIDKTEIIHRMVESGKYYFLSRPGRFGKSLLVSTIEELFSGNQEGPGTEEDVLTFTPVVCSTLIIFMAIPWPFLHSWATWL